MTRAWVIVLVSSLVVSIVTPASAEMRTETEITYRADVDQGSIDLESRLLLTNLTPDARDGDQVTRFFIEEISLTIPESAQRFSATSGGQLLSHSMGPRTGDVDQTVAVAVIDLGKRLFYQESMEVVVAYEIPGDPPRSETTFRINPAYINFAAAGWGDPGLVTVNVVTPARFDLEISGSDWDQTETVGDTTIHTVTGIDQVDDFLIRVKGYDHSALLSETLEVAGAEIVVRAWPGDGVWAEAVSKAVTAGLPTLIELVGIAWDLPGPLPLSESAEVSLAGYGGWYLRDENRIELSEWADPHLVLHELSHVWFNPDLFTGRWINEGLAEAFSRQAAIEAGLADPADLRLDEPPADTGGVGPLNSWIFPDDSAVADEIRAYEEYGYAASRWVVQEVVDEVGLGSMAFVIAAAAADRIAYQGAPPPERVEPRDDWRRFLDLLEELAGSATATRLFDEYVTDDDLTVRREARGAYHDLVGTGEGWMPPFYVREAMSSWNFGPASERISEASLVLDNRAESEANLISLGLTPGDGLQEVYESSTMSLDEATELASLMVEASETVVIARDTLDDDRNLVMELGLIGSDVEAEYREALDALEGEEFDQAVVEAGEVITLLQEAEKAGSLRIGIATAIILVIIVAAYLMIRRRGRTSK